MYGIEQLFWKAWIETSKIRFSNEFVFNLPDRPRDGVPVDASNKEALAQQQVAKASEVLEKFDITAAAKLIQRRRLPFVHATIVDEDHLLSEDEAAPSEPAPRLRRGNFGDAGPAKRGRPAPAERAAPAAATGASASSAPKPAAAGKPAGNAAQQNARNKPATAARANASPRGNASPRVNQSPRAGPQGRGVVRRNIVNKVGNTNTPNNVGNAGNRPGRNPNGISNVSRAAIQRPKRPNNNNLNANLNRAVQSLLRNTDNNGGGGGFLSRNNDLLGSNFNNRNSGGGFDDFRRNNDNFDADFSRRQDIGQLRGNDFGGRGGNSSFSPLNLGQSFSGGNNSFGGGRGFNNGNRF